MVESGYGCMNDWTLLLCKIFSMIGDSNVPTKIDSFSLQSIDVTDEPLLHILVKWVKHYTGLIKICQQTSK